MEEPPSVPTPLQTNQIMIIYHPGEGGWDPQVKILNTIDLPSEVTIQEGMSIEMTFFTVITTFFLKAPTQGGS
jgi:hypothetical protein